MPKHCHPCGYPVAGKAPMCARCGVAVPRKGNGEGFVGGKAEPTTKMYLLKATDDAAIGPGIRRSSFSRAVTLINDRLQEQVPFSAGWNIQVNQLGKAGELEGCGTLFRKDGEAMWYHRGGRIVEHPEVFPTACEGEVLPELVDPEETVCRHVDATTMKWRSSLRFPQCGEFRGGLARVKPMGPDDFG